MGCVRGGSGELVGGVAVGWDEAKKEWKMEEVEEVVEVLKGLQRAVVVEVPEVLIQAQAELERAMRTKRGQVQKVCERMGAGLGAFFRAKEALASNLCRTRSV